MSAISHIRGHEAVYINGAWLYADDKTTVNTERPCKRCGKMPTKDGHDACLGYIENAKAACCGHGTDAGYILTIV